jgi:phage host-nuclease inhibitor protein Gam
MDVNRLIATAEALGPAAPLNEIPADLAGYEDDDDPTVKGAWEVTTLASADWALRRKGECEVEIAEAEAMRRAAIDEINRRADALVERAKHGAAFFDFKLVQWMERNRTTIVHGTKKSRALVYGTVGWRNHPRRLEIMDKKALEEWLRLQPVESGLARWKVEPEMRALQERYLAEGVVPPGCTEKDEEDVPYTKAAPLALAKREE